MSSAEWRQLARPTVTAIEEAGVFWKPVKTGAPAPGAPADSDFTS